jgi:hypothetical protein
VRLAIAWRLRATRLYRNVFVELRQRCRHGSIRSSTVTSEPARRPAELAPNDVEQFVSGRVVSRFVLREQCANGRARVVVLHGHFFVGLRTGRVARLRCIDGTGESFPRGVSNVRKLG